MRLIGRPPDGHSGELWFAAVNDHTVVLDQLSAVFETRNEVILIKEELDPLPVFAVYDLIGILGSKIKEVLALFLYLEFTVELMCGELLITQGVQVNVVNYVILVGKGLSDLRIGYALEPCLIQFLSCLYLVIYILDAYDKMLSVTGKDLRVPDIDVENEGFPLRFFSIVSL